MLKAYLRQARLRQNLITAQRNIKNAIVNQVATIKAEEAAKKIRTPWEFLGALWEGVHGRITQQAMRIARDNYLQTAQPLQECTRRYSRVTSLPCPYTINDKRKTRLGLKDFNEHWLQNKVKRSPPIREPLLHPNRQQYKERQREASMFPQTLS